MLAAASQGTFWDSYPQAVQSIAYFLLSGGFFMALIALCSVLGLAVIVWKALALRRANILPEALTVVLETADARYASGEAGALASAARGSDSVLGRISRSAISESFVSKEEAAESIQARAREEVVHMEAGIAFLEVVITIAPLLGLLGTVKGLVGVFSALGATGIAAGGDPAGIALGIAEALNTTIAGLAVAVPVVIAHSYFTKKIERSAVRMEVLVGKVLSARFRPALEPAA
ncbi:hypothetical protein BH23VER1_BH23VER1_23140 [soil metagenome]